MNYILSYTTVWFIVAFAGGVLSLFFFNFIQFFEKQKKGFNSLKNNFEQLNLQQNTYNKHFIFNTLAHNCPNSYALNALTHLYQLSKYEKDFDSQLFLQYATQSSIPASIQTFFLKNSPLITLLLGIAATTYLAIMWSIDAYQFLNNTPSQSGNYELYITQLFLLTQTLIPILVAIFVACLLWLIQKIYFSLFQNHIQQINHFFVQHLFPFFTPPNQNTYFANLVNQVVDNSKLINTAAMRFEQVSVQFTTDLQLLTQYAAQSKNNIEHYAKYQEMLHTDINALTQIVNGFKFQIDNSTSGSQQITDNLLKHNATLEKINQRIHETQFNVGDWLQKIVSVSQQQQAEFAENLKKLLEMTRSNLIGTQSIINRFGNNIQKFETSMEQFQKHLNYFNSAIETSSQTQVEKLNELQIKLETIAKNLVQLNQTLPTQVQQMTTTVENTINLANPEYVKKMIDSLANERIQERIEFFQQHIDQLENQLQNQKNNSNNYTDNDDDGISDKLKKFFQFVKDANKK